MQMLFSQSSSIVDNWGMFYESIHAKQVSNFQLLSKKF